MAAAYTRPYLDALFDVAGSPDAVEALLPGLRAVAKAVDGSAELRSLVRHPGVERSRKSAVLQAIAKKAAVPALGARFLDSLLGNRRLASLSDVLSAVQERLDRERKIVEAVLSTAIPLDEKAHGVFKQVLEKKLKTTVRLKTAVDPKLISGFVIRVGSEVYDCSLAHRLQMAKAAFRTAV